MKAAVIDDLSECRNEIRDCLRQYVFDHLINEQLSIDYFCSGEMFLAAFQKQSYDLIFLDQYMKGLSGIETARSIRQKDEVVSLIFVTTSRHHAIDSYQVRASGYLLKPFQYAEFENTLSMISMKKLKRARFIHMEREKILLREILWCDIDGHYVQIHTSERGVLRYRSAFVEISKKLLDYPQFLTCYKGCIINLDQVKRIDASAFLLTSNVWILFSKRDRKMIEAYYYDYLFQKAREEDI